MLEGLLDYHTFKEAASFKDCSLHIELQLMCMNDFQKHALQIFRMFENAILSKDITLQENFNQCDPYNIMTVCRIHDILSQKDVEKLVHAFVYSRLDYCDSLLSGCPNKSLKTLQLIQNAASSVQKCTDNVFITLSGLFLFCILVRL